MLCSSTQIPISIRSTSIVTSYRPTKLPRWIRSPRNARRWSAPGEEGPNYGLWNPPHLYYTEESGSRRRTYALWIHGTIEHYGLMILRSITLVFEPCPACWLCCWNSFRRISQRCLTDGKMSRAVRSTGGRCGWRGGQRLYDVRKAPGDKVDVCPIVPPSSRII